MVQLTEQIVSELKTKFSSRLDSLIDEILEDVHNRDQFPQIVFDHIKEMLKYNLEGGKMIRGLSVVMTGRSLSPEWNQDIEDHFIVLGWCIEFLQSAFLIADDIMDEGQMRRNKLCWYRVNHVRMISIDDIFLLESQIFVLLKKYFGPSTLLTIHNHSPLSSIEDSKRIEKENYERAQKETARYLCYSHLVNIFQEVHYMTSIGQYIDTYISIERQYSAHPLEVDQVYSMKNYYDIIINKTSYYTFYLPVSLAYTYLCSLYPPTHPQYIYLNQDLLLSLCQKIGALFQIQDDYLDFYADPTQLGKIGKDIEEAKCSWLYVTLLSHCNEEDRLYCIQNYGKKETSYVDRIKQLYVQYDLKSNYLEFQKNEYESIMSTLQQNKDQIPYELFYYLLTKINNRVF